MTWMGETGRTDTGTPQAPAPLQLDGVTVLAGRGQKPVLREIRLAVKPGEWVTVLGANGSGKSTLIGVLAGLIEPDAGRVRRGFAGDGPLPYVMQQVGPFLGDTPWEETLFALEARGVKPEERAARATEALIATGLHPLRHRPLRTLSGGRRQLASVAACLAGGAPLLLLDEAAAMLDAVSRRLVLDTVRRLHRSGSAVLWCTHRPEETVPAGRIVVLQNGRIAFDRSAETFFYGAAADGRTPCESSGFAPPFAVRTARALMRRGWRTNRRPLDGEQLAEALREEAGGHGG